MLVVLFLPLMDYYGVSRWRKIFVVVVVAAAAVARLMIFGGRFASIQTLSFTSTVHVISSLVVMVSFFIFK